MKTTTILLLLSLSILSAENTSAPYTRSDTIDARDKAIKAREKLEASIVDKANDIYSARLSDKAEEEPNEDINKTEKKEDVKKEVASSKGDNSNLIDIDDILSGKK